MGKGVKASLQYMDEGRCGMRHVRALWTALCLQQ